MFHSQIIDNPVLDLIPIDVDNLIILDVAQGSGMWGFNIRNTKKGKSILIGLDIWPPYIEKLNGFNIYDELIFCDARYIPIRRRVANIVIACEIIEHIPRKEVRDFISGLERVYRNRIIISTPNGFQKSVARDENPYQKHISGWTKKDLEEMGFKTSSILINSKKGPRSIRLFIQLRAFILRRKINKALIAWKTRGLKARPRQDWFI